MRLLDSSTLKLKWFLAEHVPPYAILSHTWGDDEVSFNHMTNASESLQETAGYRKIKDCCQQAMADGFDYVWVDTCCIDKSSSAELSEAINSMFRWYQRAEVCYAYLFDLPSGDEHRLETSMFAQSRWWTRGWTLQELLAPTSVVFFDQEWVEIGTKASLQTLISDLTAIEAHILLDYYDKGDTISVAKKMSWASKRQTTRVEDRAYCLMGIFGINMPLLYGEGNNAFQRLQLEILKGSTDHTLFAWTGEGTQRGLLAQSPAEFANCGCVREVNDNWAKMPYSMTNRGLCINLPFEWILGNSSYYDRPRECGRPGEGQILAVLDCQREDQQEKDYTMLAIRVEKNAQGVFIRKNANNIENLEAAWIRRADNKQVYFNDREQTGFAATQGFNDSQTPYVFSVKKLALHESTGFTLAQVFPESWEGRGEGMRLEMVHSGRNVGVLEFRGRSERNEFRVMLGVGAYSRPWCDIVLDSDDNDLLEGIESYVKSTGTDSLDNSKALYLDRVSRSLRCGLTASVAVRKRRMDEKIQFFVDISVKPGRDARIDTLAEDKGHISQI
jgi:Heterokaryon incompatibility protein (HET)